ncbi:DUF3899 domain-containing protein [Gracilibacillus caseinilyticus]|uniref:DUF3899 domain-containing protein n=1 Tax=Gracilibacillus caseinilyticus TaxID=2932256 RepID=A0ABY4ET50_9BACI|nr:DUF3899 domain-containing protein [Gracilibacillus caseinilyticus]UOQ46922.1 DUF3899 domain-containing protein [Gracilibacillus caseinilyticus]
MTHIKRQTILFVIHLLLCLAFVFLFMEKFVLLHYINILFYLGGGYLIAGLLLYVTAKRFFDITAGSFQKVFTNTSKHKQWESTIVSVRPPSERVSIQALRFFIVQGSGLLIIMLVLLVIYYG